MHIKNIGIIIWFVILFSDQPFIVLKCHKSPSSTNSTFTLKDKNIYIGYTGMILFGSKNKYLWINSTRFP